MPFSFQVIKPDKRKRRSPAEINAAARAVIKTTLTFLGGEMQKYPPEKPKQRYIRTYVLRKGWAEAIGKIRITNQHIAMVGEMENLVPYSGLVQGRPDRQRALFRERGWKSVSDEADRVVKRFPGDIQIAISPFKD